MKVFEVLEESFLRNLVGDVRNAFKPGVAVTPNMIAELEDGLASLQRGEQPTPRQQKMMNTFMSTTLAREVKKTFDVDIEEGFSNWFKKANNPQDMQQDVVPMVKQLLDQGMSEQEVIATVEQELGVRPRYIKQAIQMVRAGLAEGRLKSKSYRKSYKAAKASGRRRKKSLRDDIAETATSGGTSAGAIATVSNPSVTRNAKKPKKNKNGTAPNALDGGANLMTGQLLKR
jgi:uncharacterized protein YoaH (UPF0181 family)